jgi:glycosyltransferase involved in cell wall biosynthesis
VRIGIDYRFLGQGPYQVSRGMGRYTQQQLREVLRADSSNEYVICCPAGADRALIDPQVLAAGNVVVRTLPAAVTRPSPEGEDDTLERVELFQAWVERCGLDLFHATTPMVAVEPVLTAFDACPLVATLYDLIPLVFPGEYLAQEVDRDGYMRAVTSLLRAQRVIAISDSARQDAFHYLGIAPDVVDVAYPVADPVFRPVPDETAAADLRRLRERLPIPGRFTLAVTHFHHSKNVYTLFSAYAMLPVTLRRELPLVLCCEIDEGTNRLMRRLTAALGIDADVVVTGMVRDAELAALYASATLVVHPSRYEGFGLPVVEAMRCGTPVVTTTASSLPEVGGGAARLVDPDDARRLAEVIAEVSADAQLREEMALQGLTAAGRFSPDQLAERTLDCYRRAVAPPVVHPGPDRLRLAIWSPVPPQRSGVADYCAELVDELSWSCDIELFVDGGFAPDVALAQQVPVHHFSAFARRSRRRPFDATIYQTGNSRFHWFMYDALRQHPGIIVLHDLAWSQVLYTERQQRGQLDEFLVELAVAEGADVAMDFLRLDGIEPSVRERARLEFLDRHPMLSTLLEGSPVQIVHFGACRDEVVDKHPDARVRVVQMGVPDPYRGRPEIEIGAARARLGISPQTFVLGSFGIVHPVKRLDTCLRAVAHLLPSIPDLLLLIPGRMASVEYAQHLRQLAEDLGVAGHVRFPGHLSKDELEAHMIATDVVVNLRTPTHQHMSAVLARAVAAGKPIVMSDLPGWSFLSEPCFVKIPVDDRELAALTAAVHALAADPALRERLSRAARVRFGVHGSARQMAAGYLRVVESLDAGADPADVRHRAAS